ncbi:MAG: aminotransferase class V-fold PLP-dependent enzyme [Eubacteriales bacterium]|nr:aminotransferase class V-fold PLP-dependent enzyme [Eubacteriales bacterium]
MIYFDNAATGFPKSGRVLAAMTKAYGLCGNPGRSGHAPAIYAAEKLYECRETLAAFFGTAPERVILTPSATIALNMAIKGFAQNKVVTSSVEHNAVFRPLYSMWQRGRADLSFFDAGGTDEQIVQRFTASLEGAYTAVFIHASNVNGRILPLREMVTEAHKSGVTTIIDASQSAGHINLSVKDSGADIICIAGHKGLYGPLGTGAMLINPSFDMFAETIIEGGTGIRSLDSEMPEEYPEHFEAGTMNAPAFAALAEAVRETEEEGLGDDRIFAKLYESLKSMKNVTVHGGPEYGYDKYVPVLLFNIRKRNCDEAMTYLAARGICVRSGFHCAPLAHKALGTENGGIRVSVGRKNTLKEADVLIDEIHRIAKSVS